MILLQFDTTHKEALLDQIYLLRFAWTAQISRELIKQQKRNLERYQKLNNECVGVKSQLVLINEHHVNSSG